MGYGRRCWRSHDGAADLIGAVEAVFGYQPAAIVSCKLRTQTTSFTDRPVCVPYPDSWFTVLYLLVPFRSRDPEDPDEEPLERRMPLGSSPRCGLMRYVQYEMTSRRVLSVETTCAAPKTVDRGEEFLQLL